MTYPPDPARGPVLDDVAKAISLLVAVEDRMLDSDDPWMRRAAHRINLAIDVLEPIR
jgi:hypothetical protein